MSSLTGESISSTYDQLLALPGGGGGGAGASLKPLTDGTGATTFALQLASDKISIGAQHKLYFDGGNNTYIHENSADELDFVVGGNTLLRIEELGGSGSDRVHVQSNVKLVIGNSDTYFIENPDDHLQLIVGSQQMMMWDQDETAGGYGTITVGVNDEGCDVQFFGESSGSYMLWDQSADKLILNNAFLEGAKMSIESVTADDTLTEAESGKMFVFADAAATLTLPDSGAGDIIGTTFKFYSNFQGTGQKVVCSDTTNEKFYGNLNTVHVDDDAAAAVPWNAKSSDSFSSINFNSVAQGEPGSSFTVTNVAADVWLVEGNILQSGGSEATPFATT